MRAGGVGRGGLAVDVEGRSMLMALGMPVIALLVVAGVLLDLMLGEARRWHPLVGFGNLASALERWLNKPDRSILCGALAWLLAVLPPVIAAIWLIRIAASTSFWLVALLHVLLLYFSIGLRSLRDHLLPIATALAAQDLPLARALTARIVSRDTADASASDLAKAGVESLLENGNDAVFGTLFWFVVAGGPGALLFRLANTLDAMWGYRTPRYLRFGRVAARIDDGLNWLPARLTALSYALLGNTANALWCWRTQAPAWSSPNAGPVMSAGAGALGLALGGAARYDGMIESRPALGRGEPAAGRDIARAWHLVLGTCALWTGVIGLIGFLLWLRG
jgi:adenosylcobinamide-phosphate synthase